MILYSPFSVRVDIQPSTSYLKAVRDIRILCVLIFISLTSSTLLAQSTISDEHRGSSDWVSRGVMDGNLIESNYRNHGELSRWNDLPWGVWPRSIGGRHIDGLALLVAGRVQAQRPAPFYSVTGDTTLSPVALNYRENAVRRNPRTGDIWGWLPLDGFLNRDRRDPVSGRFERIPAISDDPTSWPDSWPDKMNSPDDPGWVGKWNGLFGKGVFNADLETFYVMDDLSNQGYHFDNQNNEPFSPYGIYYADKSDSTIGGLGLQVEVRHLQWANVLAEDVMFLLYRITNVGGTEHDSLYFTQGVDYGLGQDENDDNASFDPQLDIAYGWDSDGIGTRTTGGEYTLGYTGFAFLESPANPFDNRDNDEDGIIDEKRDSGPGMLIEGQDAIRSYMEANYNLQNFTRVYGPIEDLPAYQAGRWWTGDENANWTSYSDANENDQWDPGEFLNDDLGVDGLGPNDLGYVGPDFGEADGVPQPGERDFDGLDIPESDQIGLRGFDLGIRANYENVVMTRDELIWQKIIENEFELGSLPPEESLRENEPFLLFLSGPVTLPPGSSDYFSLAWIFGADRDDFFKNRITVQNIYDANYNFAQAPFTPTLTAVASDKRVILGWDSVSVRSFDRFTQEFDFEGYKLYKGTDPLLFDAKTITDVTGTPTFYKPIAQWDLVNGIRGSIPVLENTASFNLGSDSGLEFFYIDEDVINGVTYYYALVAYDRGVISETGDIEIDPQENVFNFGVDAFFNLTGSSINAKSVTPRSRAAGFQEGGAAEDLSRLTFGNGTGSMSVTIVDEDEVKLNNQYKVEFTQTPDTRYSPYFYATDKYKLTNLSTGSVLLNRSLETSTPVADGFVMEFTNDQDIKYDFSRIGWVGNYGTDNETFNLDPRKIDNVQTNWIITPQTDDSPNGVLSPDDYELRWANEPVYYPPRFQTAIYLRDSLNVVAWNTTKNEPVNLLILDRNNNETFDVEDELIIMENPIPAIREFRHRFTFRVPAGETSVPPKQGEIFRLSNSKPFGDGDYFQFSLVSSQTDLNKAKEELDRIAVVPNPYLGYSIFEPRLSESTTGRGERVVQFINLPQQCTIRIYNVRGELINTLHHNATGSSNGTLEWDLRTRDGLDLAFGVYVWHVHAPGVGEKTGKLAIVK